MTNIVSILPGEVQYASDLLDACMLRLQAHNDQQLSRALEFDRAVICRLRKGKELTAWHLLRIYDKTGWSVEYIKELLYKREFQKPELSPIPAYTLGKRPGKYRKDLAVSTVRDSIKKTSVGIIHKVK